MGAIIEGLKSCSIFIKDVLTPIALFALIWSAHEYFSTKKKLYKGILDIIEEYKDVIFGINETNKSADILKFNKEEEDQ